MPRISILSLGSEVYMIKTIAFIGSFRKKDHYEIVRNGVELFRKNRIYVNSPMGSAVSRSIDKFVLFETDPQDLSPSDIQMITLDKILKSDVVFVCNLNGYVGRTTSYEIGFCLSRKVPLYFLSKPIDLPIDIPNDHVVSLEDLLTIVLQDKVSVLDCCCKDMRALNAKNQIWQINSKESPVVKHLIICGSMQFYAEMKACQDYLRSSGIVAIIPKDEGSLPQIMSEEEFRLFKKRVSSAYLRKIRDKETAAVLVYNAPKKGIDNYIGANTFVELAMAFAWNRSIYLLNDIYKPYEDELEAWDAICLNGDLNILVNMWRNNIISKETETYKQLSIFDIVENDNG